MKLISICIPTYEMHGKGAEFLSESFEILTKQTFKDFDVVISDNSTNSEIKNVCETFSKKLDIKYFKNPDPEKGMSSNVNNALNLATGKILKVLFLDDFLYDQNALQTIAENFDLEKDSWLVTTCVHTKDGKVFFNTYIPKYNSDVYIGKNTIGSPSVLAVKNEGHLLFDEHLKWLMDCDYYRRLYDTYGSPKIVTTPNVVIRIGAHQVTIAEATRALRTAEKKYMEKKFPKDKKTVLSKVTLVAVSGIDPNGAINALLLSMKGMQYFDAVLISHNKPENLPREITFKQCTPTELASTDPKNKDDYSKFIAYDLHKYIESDFCLIVHNDAYVIHPEKWDQRFLQYDYIGAPWPKNIHYTKEGVNVRVGNGGFSLRSKRLLNTLNELNLPFTDGGKGFYNEDGIICVYYRKELEEAGIQFAPVSVAAEFSHELDVSESVAKPFGFHNSKLVFPVWFWPVKKLLRKLRIVL